MAKQTVSKSFPYLPNELYACKCVILCLTDECSAYTINGKGLVEATVENTNRRLGSPFHRIFAKWNSRATDIVQLTFTLDDAQLNIDPATSKPYIIECCCIAEVMPYSCTISKLLA